MSHTKTPAYFKGFEAKIEEISSMGWEAARNLFNSIYPPGTPWSGSSEGLQYARGEFDALASLMPK